MKGVYGEFYFEGCINNAIFEEKEKLTHGKLNGQTKPCWVVSVYALFDHFLFLTILDETGEPLYFQNSNTFKFEIEKDSNGNYYKIEN